MSEKKCGSNGFWVGFIIFIIGMSAIMFLGFQDWNQHRAEGNDIGDETSMDTTTNWLYMITLVVFIPLVIIEWDTIIKWLRRD